MSKKVTGWRFCAGGGHIYLGRVSGVSSPYTMEILYQLGITQDLGTKNRLV